MKMKRIFVSVFVFFIVCVQASERLTEEFEQGLESEAVKALEEFDIDKISPLQEYPAPVIIPKTPEVKILQPIPKYSPKKFTSMDQGAPKTQKKRTIAKTVRPRTAPLHKCCDTESSDDEQPVIKNYPPGSPEALARKISNLTHDERLEVRNIQKEYQNEIDSLVTLREHNLGIIRKEKDRLEQKAQEKSEEIRKLKEVINRANHAQLQRQAHMRRLLEEKKQLDLQYEKYRSIISSKPSSRAPSPSELFSDW